jgi:serine/threonine protein kinase
MKVREDEPPGKEGHILSHLRLIRHPNVVRLIALYSYRGSLHLLFPRARSDLAKFLSASERPIGLQTNLSIVLATQGLCGAVASLHRFVVPEFNLHMKGYHHDLKPENILVDDTEFLLSDFGLSTLKEVEANSKTLFKEVMGYYIAPECQSIEDGFKKNLIGQSSDIWALGCIIAVILTYMLHGATGVEEFESKRKSQVLNWTTYRFHTNGALNPGVDTWLTHLANNEDPIGAEFSAVIRDMLRIDPDTRPNAQQVLSSVNSLAARSLFRSTERQFKHLARKLNDLCVDVEHERFIVFAQAIRLDNARRDNARFEALTEPSEFHSLKVQFENLQEILNATVDTLQTPQTSSFIQSDLRSCVDGLWNLLPRGTRLRCERILERRLISTDDLNLLRGIQDSFIERPQYRNIGLLAAMKYMKKLVDKDQVQNQTLRWAPGSILALGLKVNHQANIARVLPKDATKEKEALIEWIEYDDRWRNDVGEELFLRVEAIAELLSKPDKPTGFRGLDCTGYFHKSSRHSFGLIFDLPMLAAEQTQGECFAPCSLLSLIEKIRDLELRPSLGDKFQLANNIATSVYEWHKADWLHKAISSFNVIVFPGAFQSEAACITMPFIIGFNHCRPDEPNAVSVGPPEHPDQMDYSHPGYLKNRSRYRREYDYYSLGIVLLEIGLWKPLRSLAAKFSADDQSPEQLREFLLERHVARLHTRMGMVYQNAVRTCLTFDTSNNPHTTRTTSIDVLDIFEDEVVTPLGKCFA